MKFEFDKIQVKGEGIIDTTTGEVFQEKAKSFLQEQEKGEDEETPKKKRGSIIDRLKEWLNESYMMLHNEITLELEFLPIDGQAKWKEMGEREENDMILAAMQEVGGSGLEKVLSKILRSSFVKGYDPVQNFFEGLAWDGEKRFDRLASTIKIQKDNIDYEFQDKQYSTSTDAEWPRLLKKWMMASIHCGLGKGENQAMLLLIGDQGKGKTTWINKLCPPQLQKYSHTGHIEVSLNSESTQNRLAEMFWLNIDDQLGNALHKDVQGFKGIVSCPAVTNRKKFHKSARRRPRRANMCGSVNETAIFSDHENRRYLAFKMASIPAPIDWKGISEMNIEQVWAELWHEYKNDQAASWKVNPQDFAIINAMCSKFTRPTAEEELLLKHFRKPTFDELTAEHDPFSNGPDQSPEYWMLTELHSYLQNLHKIALYPRNLTNALQKHGWKPESKRIINKKLAKGSGQIVNPRWVYALIEVKDN